MVTKQNEKRRAVFFIINKKERAITPEESATGIIPVDAEAIVYLDQKRQPGLYYIDPLGR